jgi:hypothetical protein
MDAEDYIKREEERKQQRAVEVIRDRLLKSVKETAEKNKYYFFKENNYGN